MQSEVLLTKSPECMQTIGGDPIHEVRERREVVDSVDKMPPEARIGIPFGGPGDWAHEGTKQERYGGVEG